MRHGSPVWLRPRWRRTVQLPVLLYQVRPTYCGDCRYPALRAAVAAISLCTRPQRRRSCRSRVRWCARRSPACLNVSNVQVALVEAGRDPVSGDEAFAYVALSEYGEVDLMRCDAAVMPPLQEPARTRSCMMGVPARHRWSIIRTRLCA
jgi:prolyl-tRNA synthetase